MIKKTFIVRLLSVVLTAAILSSFFGVIPVNADSPVYAPSADAWGTQGNNGWYWMYQDKVTGVRGEIPFNTEPDYANQFSCSNKYALMSVSQQSSILPVAANLVLAFKAPVGGSVTFSLNAVATPETAANRGRVSMAVSKNDIEPVMIDGYGSSFIEMENDDQLRTYTFTTDVKENTMVYISFACDYAHFLWFGTAFPSFSASYNSVNNEKEPEANSGGDSLKVLAIGNSFTEDSTKYLREITVSAGYGTCIVGNLYIGGCDIATHYNNAVNNSAVYTYYKNTVGTWTQTLSATMEQALIDEDWDVIVIHQGGGDTGIGYDLSNLDNLVALVKDKISNKSARILWNMTWAYPADSIHPELVSYDYDQQRLYDAIVSLMNNTILPDENFDGIIPTGTAVQNARTSTIGDNMTRDFLHLSYHFGRYLAGLTWFAAITGRSLDSVTCRNQWISETDALIAKDAAAKAVASPLSVTQSAYPSGVLSTYRLDRYTDWGTQGVNNWYYMYKNKLTGEYAELPFNQDAAFSNCFSNASVYEHMHFQQNGAYHTAAAAYPVLAFKVPVGGTIKVNVSIYRGNADVVEGGTDSMYLKVYNNNEQTGASNVVLQNNFSPKKYTYTLDVQKNGMVYVVTECENARGAWIYASIDYYSTNDEVYNPDDSQNLVGKAIAPSEDRWGEQNNNGWYWMYQDKATGSYGYMDYGTSISNQFTKMDLYEGFRAYKSDLMVPEEAKLVIAFKAPSGGNLTINLNAVMAPESESNPGRIRMSVLKNGCEGVNIDGYNASSIEMENDNMIRTYSFTTDVKKNTMIYIAFECDYLHFLWFGTPFPTFSAIYNSVNDSAETGAVAGSVYAPTAESWGTQGNGSWYWMVKDKTTGTYAPQDFGTVISDQFSAANQYAGQRTSKSDAMVPADAEVVFAFRAPTGGKVKFSFNAVMAPESDSNPGRITMSVMKDSGYGVEVDGHAASSFIMENDNMIRTYTFTTEVKTGSMVYISFSCDYLHYLWLGNAFPSFSASYITAYNDELLGDANGDTAVDVRDLIRMKKYSAQSVQNINTYYSDLDNDYQFSVSDIILLKKMLLGTSIG